jgi:hypothetical protein
MKYTLKNLGKQWHSVELNDRQHREIKQLYPKAEFGVKILNHEIFFFLLWLD